jgi:hypothetical protein
MPETPVRLTPVRIVPDSRTAPRIVALLIVCLVAFGCNSSQPESSGSSTGTSGNTDAKADETRAVASLESSIAELQPDEFGINVPVELPLSGLNEWGDADLADRLNPLVDEEFLREELSRLLAEELVDRVLRKRFVTRDATHARDAIWAQQAVTNLRTRDSSPASRVFALFYYAMHTVQLVPEAEDQLPLGPYEVAFFGRGTAADRAWIFGTLLNELKIPSAVVRLVEIPAGEDQATDKPGGESGIRLVVALIDGELHLFDVVLGLPVSLVETAGAARPDALPQAAVTLSQAIADDGVFRQFDLDSLPYPVTSEMLKQARLEIIGDTTLWSRRMEGLSEALTGDQSVTLHRPLVSAGDQDGSFDSIRDSAGGVVPVERIGVWFWPEERREAQAGMSPLQKQQLNDLKSEFQTPLPITQIGPEFVVIGDSVRVPKLTVGTGWRYLLRARTSQLQGKTSDAIELYTRIQGFSPLPPPIDESLLQSLPQNEAVLFGTTDAKVKALLSLGLPDDVRTAHLVAGEAAEFWNSACHLEKRNWQAAARAFERYLSNPNNEQFSDAARIMVGVALQNAGQQRRALAFLRTIRSPSPNFVTAQYLSRRWSEAGDSDQPAR